MRYLTVYAFIAITALSSCDYESQDLYTLHNKSDSTLYITFKYLGVVRDSEMTYPPYTSNTFDEVGYLSDLNDKWVHFPSEATKTLKIFTDAAHLSEVNFDLNDRNNWTHEVKLARRHRKDWGANHYTLVIENEDL